MSVSSPVFWDRRQITAWKHWRSLLSKPDNHELSSVRCFAGDITIDKPGVQLKQTLNSNPNCLLLSLLAHKLIRFFGSCPSGHLDVMPVRVLSEGAGPDAQVPKQLTRIPISLISMNTDSSDKMFKVCWQQVDQKGLSFSHKEKTDLYFYKDWTLISHFVENNKLKDGLCSHSQVPRFSVVFKNFTYFPLFLVFSCWLPCISSLFPFHLSATSHHLFTSTSFLFSFIWSYFLLLD